MLKDRQAEKEKLLLVMHQAVITGEDIEQLDRFAAEIRSRLPHMTFAEKRRVIEALKFTGTLASEEEEKVVYIHWHVHTWRFSLHTELPSVFQREDSAQIITFRFVMPKSSKRKVTIYLQ